MGRMPSSANPAPGDDAFARQLFGSVFQKRVFEASWPIFPKKLQPEAEDIIARALERAYEKRGQYRGKNETNLLAWVLVILRNLTRDILRSSEGRPLLEPLSGTLEDKKPRRQVPD